MLPRAQADAHRASRSHRVRHSSLCWPSAGSSFTATAFVVSEAGSDFALDPNTFRLLSGFGFLTYVVAFMLGAPLAFGVAIVAWRTLLLPRWLAAVSFLAGIGALASFTFITTLVYVAWILLLSG